MSAKRQKIEAEVLKNRNEQNFERLSEAIKLLSNKYGSSDPVFRLLDCEVELEKYLVDHELTSENVRIAKKCLSTIKEKLLSIQSQESKDSMFKVNEERSLLLGKIHFAQGNIGDALESYKNKLDTIKPKSLPLYMLRLLSESFAIKGLCLEQDMIRSKTESKETPANCYEESAKFLFQYLIQRDQMYANQQAGNASDDCVISSVIENAIQRATFLHIKNKEPWKGINLLRQALKCLHSHTFNIRQTLACNLATVLLRGVSKTDYNPDHDDDAPSSSSPYLDVDKKSEMKNNSLNGQSASSYNTPHKPKFFLGEKQLHPTTVDQEVILLIRISEAMLNMDPVLDMSPLYAGSRENTLARAEFLYNLLAVALAPLGQFPLFAACIEKSLKYAFERFHLWNQFALALYASGKGERAIQSFAECSRIEADNPLPLLLAAKSCYRQLAPPDYQRGFRYSELALQVIEKNADEEENDDVRLRCMAQLCLGVGASHIASQSFSKAERTEMRAKAVAAFSKASLADPDHYKPFFFLSLELARARKIGQALKMVNRALDLNPEDPDCLHLLALLQVSKRQFSEALSTVRTALVMYPQNLGLLVAKCQLQLKLDERAEALRSCDEIVRLWAESPKATDGGTVASSFYDRATSDGISVTNHSLGGELDVGSSYAASLAPSRWEATASDLGSFADIQPRLSYICAENSRVWLQISDVYLSVDRFDEAEMCVAEASLLYPLSPDVIYMRGRLHEYKEELHEASVMYNNVLAIDPMHLQAIESLAAILRRLGKRNAAKKLLQDAVALDATSHTVWQQLGEILEEEGDVDGAIQCTNLTLNLEGNSTLLSLFVIPMQI